MEVSGAVSRHLPALFRREISQSMQLSGADARRAPCSLSVSGRSVGTGTRGFGLVGRRNMDSSRFCDDGHLRYYDGPRCHGGRLKKEKEAVKKNLKLLKGLSGDLSAAYELGFVFRFDDGLVGEFPTDRFSVEETREALGRQLQQLKAEEKEQKRKRKLEKAKLKAARVQIIHDSSSSSSSSESSDNEGNMINTRSYRIRKALSQPFPDQWKINTIQGSTLLPPPSLSQPFPDQWQTNAIQGSTLPLPLQTHVIQESTLPPPLQTQQLENVSVARSASVGRVEVCMGNKCKKAGAAALMEEFERVMGADGAVYGCKCMGKCRDGPNVRVSANPMCNGVGMEDVGRIVADYLGQEGQKQSSFAPAI